MGLYWAIAGDAWKATEISNYQIHTPLVPISVENMTTKGMSNDLLSTAVGLLRISMRNINTIGNV